MEAVQEAAVTPEVITGSMTQATLDVMSMLAGMEAVVGESYTVVAGDPTYDGVFGLIGMAGPWVGTGAVSCSSRLACRIASNMLMAEYDSVNDDVLDAMAEVTNMTIGNVKTAVEEIVGPMGLSVPTVVFGRNFATRSVTSAQWHVVPFTVEGEKLEVRVCLEPNRDSNAVIRPGFLRPVEIGH